jgi:hypothetical protein
MAEQLTLHSKASHQVPASLISNILANRELLFWSLQLGGWFRVTPQDIEPYPWVFDERPFYLILNLALGGSLGGKIRKSDLPGNLLVDYVRVYPLDCE